MQLRGHAHASGAGQAVVTDPERLRAISLFADFGDDALQRVSSSTTLHRYERGDRVFCEGDASHHLYVMLRGRIAITSRADDGRESMFALMEDGDVFGEMGMLIDNRRSAHARALEPSEVLEVPYDVVRAEFDAEPRLLWSLAGLLAERLRNVDAALADSLFLDVTGRTAKRLLELADGADEFTLPVTQEELAGMVGASRERVNKALASFVRLGWLKVADRQYTLVDRQQLTRRAT